MLFCPKKVYRVAADVNHHPPQPWIVQYCTSHIDLLQALMEPDLDANGDHAREEQAPPHGRTAVSPIGPTKKYRRWVRSRYCTRARCSTRDDCDSACNVEGIKCSCPTFPVRLACRSRWPDITMFCVAVSLESSGKAMVACKPRSVAPRAPRGRSEGTTTLRLSDCMLHAEARGCDISLHSACRSRRERAVKVIAVASPTCLSHSAHSNLPLHIAQDPPYRLCGWKCCHRSHRACRLARRGSKRHMHRGATIA